MDHYGEGQVAVNYDLMNLAKIEWTKKSALAKCRVNAHLELAKKMQKLSDRGVSRQGALARVNYIYSKFSRFDQIRRQLKSAVASKAIKDKSRERVLKLISSIIERADGLRAKALSQDQHRSDGLMRYIELEQSLTKSIIEQHLLKKRSDFSRNVRLTVSGGYAYEDDDKATLENEGLDGFARITLSVNLGVLNPAWRYGKDAELQAELDKLYAQGSGALWRVKNTFEKNKLAVAALRDKRSLLERKMAEANRKRKAIPAEKIDQIILLELDMIKLRSEIIEINTNLTALAKAQKLLAP